MADRHRQGGSPIVLEPVPELGVEEQEASSDSHEESGAPAAKIPRAEDRRSSYMVVGFFGAIFRLHRSGAMGVGWGGDGNFGIVKNSQAR